jgi:hypothetical protein
MGVEYRHFVVPADRTWVPSADEVRAIARDLVQGGWVPAEEHDALVAALAGTTGDVCHVVEIDHEESPDVRYPFGGRPEDPEAYWTVQIHRSGGDFIAPFSETLTHESEYGCACGVELQYDDEDDPFGALRVRTRCADCGSRVDPGAYRAIWDDDGDEKDIPAPLYRFAIAIDCGKCLPDFPAALSPELMRLLGKGAAEFGEIY